MRSTNSQTIQLTHDYNYRDAGNALGADLVTNPDIVATVPYAFKSAGWFWRTKNLNALADSRGTESFVC